MLFQPTTFLGHPNEAVHLNLNNNFYSTKDLFPSLRHHDLIAGIIHIFWWLAHFWIKLHVTTFIWRSYHRAKMNRLLSEVVFKISIFPQKTGINHFRRSCIRYQITLHPLWLKKYQLSRRSSRRSHQFQLLPIPPYLLRCLTHPHHDNLHDNYHHHSPYYHHTMSSMSNVQRFAPLPSPCGTAIITIAIVLSLSPSQQDNNIH